MKKTALIGGILLLLVGCQAPVVAPFVVSDYRDEALAVQVSAVQVENNTVRYRELPHIETRMPVLPAVALKQALENRFRAGRTESGLRLILTIQQADMTQKKQEGAHWYILDNVEYLLSYQVRVDYVLGATSVETQEIGGWEKQALPKRSSLAEKEEVWQKMLNAMIQKVCDKIQADMPPNLF